MTFADQMIIGCVLIAVGIMIPLNIWVLDHRRRRLANEAAARWGLERMPGETTSELLIRVRDRIGVD